MQKCQISPSLFWPFFARRLDLNEWRMMQQCLPDTALGVSLFPGVLYTTWCSPVCGMDCTFYLNIKGKWREYIVSVHGPALWEWVEISEDVTAFRRYLWPTLDCPPLFCQTRLLYTAFSFNYPFVYFRFRLRLPTVDKTDLFMYSH